jgi:hypothetical protein
MTGKILRCWAFAGLTLGLLAGTARAVDYAPPGPWLPNDAVDEFKLFVGDAETYDSNLFRVPPGTVGVPGSVFPRTYQADYINSVTAGGEGKYDIDLQEFDLRAQIDDNRFYFNDGLNYVGGNATGTWNWRAGPYLSGDAGAIYDRSLASFGQTRFSGFDLVTSTTEFGSAHYQLGPHWSVYGGIQDSRSDHSAAVVNYNDFHNKNGDVGVLYVNNANNSYGFEYKYVDFTFRQGGAEEGYDYKEDTGRVLVHYQVSDKTIIDAYGGYLRRQYPSPSLAIGTFSGEIGRITATYNFTEKTQFILAGWHELHAYVDAESAYFVAQGASISPVWNVTDKLSFVLLASFENQDYITSNSVIVTNPRHDRVYGDQATVRFSPRDAWVINVFFRHDKRESNEYVYSYDDNLVAASVTFSFL